MTTSICKSFSPSFLLRVCLPLVFCFSAVLPDLRAGTAMTWNMEWFPCKGESDLPKAPARIKAAQEVLLALAPDILLFQEVNDWKSAQQVVDGLPGYKLGMVTAFKGSRQQMGIVSRYPVDSAWYEQFANYETEEKGPPRGFAFAALQPVPGKFILCYSVHLKSNHGDRDKNIRAREEGARQIIRHVEAMNTIYSAKGKVAVIVAGDFNTLQDDPKFSAEATLKLFQDAGFVWSWKDVPKEQRTTWPASGGYSDATFDHFFSKGLPSSSAKVSGHYDVSDHSPVILTW